MMWHISTLPSECTRVDAWFVERALFLHKVQQAFGVCVVLSIALLQIFGVWTARFHQMGTPTNHVYQCGSTKFIHYTTDHVISDLL